MKVNITIPTECINEVKGILETENIKIEKLDNVPAPSSETSLELSLDDWAAIIAIIDFGLSTFMLIRELLKSAKKNEITIVINAPYDSLELNKTTSKEKIEDFIERHIVK